MDKITLNRIQLLHPILRTEALAMYVEIYEALTGNAYCRFSHTLRTNQEQADLYAIGRTKPGRKVTNAGPGFSFHNYGLAFDIVLIIDNKEASWDMNKDFDKDATPDWKEVVRIAKSYGWEWGGDWKSFKDYPHFQKTFGKKISELREFPKENGYPILK